MIKYVSIFNKVNTSLAPITAFYFLEANRLPRTVNLMGCYYVGTWSECECYCVLLSSLS